MPEILDLGSALWSSSIFSELSKVQPLIGLQRLEVTLKSKICLSVLLLSSLGFSACLKVEPKSKSEEVVNQQVPAASTAGTKITYMLKGKNEPNQYSIHFSDVDSLYIRKIKNGVSTVDRTDGAEYVDENVVSGEKITYQFYRESGTQQTILESVDVQIPRDLVFDKKVILNKKTIEELGLTVEETGFFRKVSANSFRRIFFLKGTEIVTSGENLELVADEIHFHQTVIQTFEKSQTADQGKEGRHGGTLNFKARLMSGDVFVELRGENGGQGPNGLPPGESLAGTNGEPGKAPEEYTPANCSYLSILCGACRSPGEVGRPGGNGKKGNDGFTGMTGGNSGELNWTAEDATNLNWKVIKSPGAGGAGGSGGAGGRAGKGAPGTSSMYCGVVPAAEDGIPGPFGDRGFNGISGQLEPACLQILDEKFCR